MTSCLTQLDTNPSTEPEPAPPRPQKHRAFLALPRPSIGIVRMSGRGARAPRRGCIPMANATLTQSIDPNPPRHIAVGVEPSSESPSLPRSSSIRDPRSELLFERRAILRVGRHPRRPFPPATTESPDLAIRHSAAPSTVAVGPARARGGGARRIARALPPVPPPDTDPSSPSGRRTVDVHRRAAGEGGRRGPRRTDLDGRRKHKHGGQSGRRGPIPRRSSIALRSGGGRTGGRWERTPRPPSDPAQATPQGQLGRPRV